MLRVLFLAAPLLLLATASTAGAQERSSNERCEQRSSAGRSVGRGILGGLAGRALGRLGGAAAVAIPAADVMTDEVLKLLNCREQRQAVAASEQAVRGGVGTTASWTSESRSGVSGSSAATGEETLADGTHCMTVTDIVIVDGEETRAPKRMCRSPGSARYARV